MDQAMEGDLLILLFNESPDTNRLIQSQSMASKDPGGRIIMHKHWYNADCMSNNDRVTRCNT